MPIEIVKDYYTKQKAKLIKNFNKYTNDVRKVLARKFDDAKLDNILKHMSEEYENLIPKIPYIGGDTNLFTETIILAISRLAIFWTLEKEGFSFREIGEFFYELVDDEIRLDKANMEKNGQDPAQYPFEMEIINLSRSSAKFSQKRTFPYDTVMDFVEGDGVSFDHGLNISECGILKVFNKLGAEKYMPLQCMIAMRYSHICGYGLFRTQTLTIGAPTCDYRYIKKLKAPQNITVEEVTYYKEKKICLVCKGIIEGFNNYICPKCEVLYCENCARTLVDLENVCWVCDAPLDESKPSKHSKRKEDDIPIKKSSQKKSK